MTRFGFRKTGKGCLSKDGILKLPSTIVFEEENLQTANLVQGMQKVVFPSGNNSRPCMSETL